MSDEYTPYETGLGQLLSKLLPDHPRQAEVRTLEARLRENIAASRRYGDSENRRADRHQIVAQLNELAQACCGCTFNALCEWLPTSAASNTDARLQPVGTNPFQYGNPVAPEHFYGRHAQLATIKDRIGKLTPESLSIVGHRRSGKSSLLRYIAERPFTFCRLEQRPLIVTLDLQDARYHTPAGITEGLRRGIEGATGEAPWQRSENTEPFAVDDGLTRLRDQGYTLLVLIDEFERIGTRLEAFQGWGEDWRAKASAQKLVLVIASTKPLDALYQSLGLTSPFDNIFISTTLGSLETVAWQALVRDGFAHTNRPLPVDGLALVAELAGGLPYYTQLAAGLLWQLGDAVALRAEFSFQTTRLFRSLWADLSTPEQQCLRALGGSHGAALADSKVIAELQRHGLVQIPDRLFSTAFADFVRHL